MLGDRLGKPLAEGAEEVGPGLEAVLVEVVRAATPRAQDEVAVQQRVVGQRPGELFVRHGRAAARNASVARASAAVTSGVVGCSDSIAPSS